MTQADITLIKQLINEALDQRFGKVEKRRYMSVAEEMRLAAAAREAHELGVRKLMALGRL